MPRSPSELQSRRRAADKAESRRRDEERLASGDVGRDALARANSFFSSLNVSGFQLSAIGRRRIGDPS